MSAHDDLLGSAVEALRSQSAGRAGGDRAILTRERVLHTVHRRKVRRAQMTTAASVFAVILMTSTVVTAATGQLPAVGRAVVRAVTTVVRPAAKPAPKPRPVPAAVPAAPEPIEEPAAVEIAEPALEPAVVPAPTHAPAPIKTRPHRATRADEDRIYRAAHKAHFVERDWAVALALWNQYLIEQPKGRFALEARYNRALCLLRLERHAEAVEALEPFARGAYGDYRQREAKALIDAFSAEHGGGD